jgi:hypothetical protein
MLLVEIKYIYILFEIERCDLLCIEHTIFVTNCILFTESPLMDLEDSNIEFFNGLKSVNLDTPVSGPSQTWDSSTREDNLQIQGLICIL